MSFCHRDFFLNYQLLFTYDNVGRYADKLGPGCQIFAISTVTIILNCRHN